MWLFGLNDVTRLGHGGTNWAMFHDYTEIPKHADTRGKGGSYVMWNYWYTTSVR